MYTTCIVQGQNGSQGAGRRWRCKHSACDGCRQHACTDITWRRRQWESLTCHIKIWLMVHVAKLLPPWAGSCPDPPPDSRATLPLRLSRSDRSTTLWPFSKDRPPQALTRPQRASSTQLSDEFISFSLSWGSNPGGKHKLKYYILNWTKVHKPSPVPTCECCS